MLACGAPQTSVRSASVPSQTELPIETVRELASCGGSGPDTLVLSLSRIPAESDLRRAICDWFSDEPWRVRVRSLGPELPRAERPSPGELYVTILLASASAAQLNVTAPPRDAGAAPERWLERVPLSSGLDDVGIEVLAQTLHSTAQASLSRAFRPAPPVAAPPAAPAPVAARVAGPSVELAAAAAATPPAATPVEAAPVALIDDRSRGDFARQPPRPLPVHTALGYQFHARGAEPLTHGPVLRIELDWLTRSAVLSSFVRAGLFTSTPARSSGIEIGLDGMDLGAGLAASLPWKHWLGRMALGTSLDVVGIQVNLSDNQALRSLGKGHARPRVFLTAETGVAARLGRFEFGLDGLLRWQTSSSHYDVLEGGQPHTLLRAWRLQPGAALEVAYAW